MSLRSFLIVAALLPLAIALAWKGWFADYIYPEELAIVQSVCEYRDSVARHNGHITSVGIDSQRNVFTDQKLSQLKGLPKLEELLIEYTPVTDAGLSHLHQLKQLKFICLTGTRVTAKGVADLRTALPNCQIDWSNE